MISRKSIRSFDGTRIRYRICRQKKEFLIFVHGISGNYSGFNFQLSFFEKKGYSTIALDLRGHGESDFPKNNDFSMESVAKDINSIMVKEKVKDAVFIGHCFGAAVCMVFYGLFPKKVSKLVIINSTYLDPVTSYRRSAMKKLKPLIRKIYNLGIIMTNKRTKAKNARIDFTRLRKLPDSIIIASSTFMFTDLKTISNYHKQFLGFNATKIIKKIKARTLIIGGEKDLFFPPRISESMGRIIKNSKVVVLEKVNHLSVLKNPDQVNDYTLRFLEGKD